jgi:hypothetical protein
LLHIAIEVLDFLPFTPFTPPALRLFFTLLTISKNSIISLYSKGFGNQNIPTHSKL